MSNTFFAGIVLVLLILSTKTGIILGSSWLNRKQIILVSIIFGVILMISVFFMVPYTDYIAQITEKYTLSVSLLLAFLLIYLGNKNDSKNFLNTNKLRKRLDRCLVFLPCPFCLIAISLSVLLAKAQAQIFHRFSELYVSFIFVLLLIIISFVTRFLITGKNKNPGNTFNTFLLFIGLMTGILSLFIPNFVSSAQMNFSPVILESLKVVLFVGLSLGLLMAIGYISKRNMINR
ncbi:MAG: hypothetical protein CVU88_07860 [Firmicutes bacterium HGW-Firmicutes-13]|nr:MAG: hypothetical protein CVU88_07860 [Firmicutes bacterium HGW-Firmicutes-13]